LRLPLDDIAVLSVQAAPKPTVALRFEAPLKAPSREALSSRSQAHAEPARSDAKLQREYRMRYSEWLVPFLSTARSAFDPAKKLM
jgi:hypothetical protein